MSAIMSQKGRKIAEIMHDAAKKFDWIRKMHVVVIQTISNLNPTALNISSEDYGTSVSKRYSKIHLT